MIIVTKVTELSSYILPLKSAAQKIGFIPTMGALHEGHLSLIEKSKKENDFTVVSIFVNPTQFDKKEDLDNYPSTLQNDLNALKEINCDLVFTPTVNDIYENNVAAEKFFFDGLENEMEGKHRKNHFDGVATIVKKLFELVQPTHAYFGEKDFQQLQIVRKLTEKFTIPTKIVGCEIFREKDGLAMSSRNIRLNEIERKNAPFIHQTLLKVQTKCTKESFSEVQKWVENEFKNHPNFTLEYFEIAEENTLKTAIEKKPNTKYRAFIAVYANTVRLIDNKEL